MPDTPEPREPVAPGLALYVIPACVIVATVAGALDGGASFWFAAHPDRIADTRIYSGITGVTYGALGSVMGATCALAGIAAVRVARATVGSSRFSAALAIGAAAVGALWSVALLRGAGPVAVFLPGAVFIVAMSIAAALAGRAYARAKRRP